MKRILTLLAATVLTGCSAFDEIMRAANYNPTGQSGSYYQKSEPYNKSAYNDGYQQGYRAGYYDAERNRSYRPQSNYGGSSYNSAFSDGYYQGYDVGFYDSKNRRGYRL
jgi:hypothetical protein